MIKYHLGSNSIERKFFFPQKIPTEQTNIEILNFESIFLNKKQKLNFYFRETMEISIYILQKLMNQYIFYQRDLTRKRIIFRIREKLNEKCLTDIRFHYFV